MAIYELEDRIYFDGAFPADIIEAENTSEQEIENIDTAENNNESGDTDNSENVSITPDIYSPEDSDDNSDNDSDSDDTLGSYQLSNDNSQSLTNDIATIIDSIEDITITDNILANQNYLLVSSDNENFEKITDSVNNDTILITYDSDDTFDSIIQKLKDELGDTKAVNIGIIDSDNDIFELGSVETEAFLNELYKLNDYDGEINLFQLENNKSTSEAVNSDTTSTEFTLFTLSTDNYGVWNSTENSDTDSLTDYFYSDSSLLSSYNNELITDNNLSSEDLAKEEIVFINSSVMDADEIVDELPDNAEIVYLTAGHDGIQEISDYLADKTDIDTIRIISHGNEGYFVLNGQIIDSDYVTENADIFYQWRSSLSENADIMLYGCNLAATTEGQELVQYIASYTDADVAAATHITGGTGNTFLNHEGHETHEDLFFENLSFESSKSYLSYNTTASSWTLDFTVGSIESSQLSVDSYKYHLESHTVTSNADDGANTLRYWIDNASSGDEIVFNLTSGNETIRLADVLMISTNLTIDGNNSAGSGTDITISGNDGISSNCQIFFINSCEVTIENMTLTNGLVSSMGGGAICTYGATTLTMSNITVSASIADGVNGGGIYNDSGTVDITDCTFSNNAATTGAGLYNNSGTVNLYGTNTFSGNMTDNAGDAIYNASGTLNLNDSTLKMSEDNPLYNAGTFNAGTSTVVYNGGITQISDCNITFNNLELTSGTVLQDPTGHTITISGETSGNGTVTSTSSTTFIYSGGNQTVYSGSYGTLSFSGSTTGSTKTFVDGTTSIASDINITDTITLTGESLSTIVQVTTPGTTASRVFDIDASGETITLENMTIKGGNISGQMVGDGWGGGIKLQAGTLGIDSVTVSDATAVKGGGIYVTTSGMISSISNSTINNNTATGSQGQGGGIFNAGTISSISDSLISGNESNHNGGGIYNANNISEITNTTISSNTATDSGGGIYNASATAVTITDSTLGGDNDLDGNTATTGGGGLWGTFDISNSTISKNTLIDSSQLTNTVKGGGAYLTGTSSIYNSTISGNVITADYDGECNMALGGGIFIYGATSIQNSTISGNTATVTCGSPDTVYAEGGGVYIQGGKTLNIVNSTISGNTAEATNSGTGIAVAYGGGIYNSYTMNMLNSVIVTNTVTAADIANGSDLYGGNCSVYYSWSGDNLTGTNNNQGGSTAGVESSASYHGGFSETVSIDTAASANAAAGSYAYYNSTDDYYYENSGSYFKIAGQADPTNPISFTPTGTPADQKITTDQRGYYRNATDSNTITRGAYQYNGVVAKIGESTSWTEGTLNTDTFTTIQAAENHASSGTASGSEIILAGTAILESNITIDKSVTIQGESGVDPTKDPTYVQAAQSAGTVSDRVFNITAGTVTLEDMTIRYGNTTGNGGGIIVDQPNSTFKLDINNLTICDNTAAIGGGIYIVADGGGDIVVNIASSTISGNTATGTGGGGIYSHDGSNTVDLGISNSTISGNRASDSSGKGGGIYNFYSAITLTNSTIAGNTAGSSEGGGVYFNRGSLNVRNSILVNNTASGSPNDYFYASGTLFDNGYNVVEYQNLAAAPGNHEHAFDDTNDILYNTVVGDPTISHSDWNQNGNNLANQTLGLSTTLADNGGPTLTLALSESSFAVDAIPYADAGSGIWNGSPTSGGSFYDQRGIQTTANNPISIGAYSAFSAPSTLYYMAKTTGNWSSAGESGIWYTNTTGGIDPNDYTTRTAGTVAPNSDNSDGIIINDDINVTVAAGGFSIDQVTVDTGASIIINNGQTVTLANGTDDDLTVAGTGALDVNGTLDAGAAQIVFSGAGALNLVQTSFSVNSFTAGTSTVTLDGGVAQTIGSDITFNNLTLSTGTVLTTSNNITVSGATSGAGTVNASAGTFTYSRSGDQNIFSGTYNAVILSGNGTKSFTETNTVTGGVTIESSLTVTGSTSTASDTAVQVHANAGSGNSRVFTIATDSLAVTLQNMTIRNGVVTGSNGGAGILVSENNITLSLDNIDLNNNIIQSSATGDPYGAGLLVKGNDFNVTISNSSIHHNINNADHGGGIAFARTNGAAEDTSQFTIDNTSIYSNSIETYSSGYGGGVYTEYINSNATSSISNSTIYSNSTTSVGGGISVHDISLNVTNTTISDNTSEGYGGGMRSSSSTVSLNSVTIANNLSDNSNSGGGYYLNSGSLTIQNSIIANNNSGSTPVRNDFYNNSGSVTDNGYNIVGVSSNYSWIENTDWMLQGTSGDTYYNVGTPASTGDLYLSSTLADNGGPTQTLAITSASSIAVGNGSTTEVFDQRGYYRGLSGGITIGAYEYNAAAPSDGNYISVAIGNWSDYETVWETYNSSSGEWETATVSPDSANSSLIIVSSGDTVTVTSDLTIDQTVISSGGTVITNITGGNEKLTIADGTGTDLTAYGSITVSLTDTLLVSSNAAVDADGTFTVNGTLSFDDAGDNNGTLNIASTYTINTLTAGSSTITYDGTGAQTVTALTYYNLSLSGGSDEAVSIKTLASGTTSVENDLTVAQYNTLAADTNTLNLTGTSGTADINGTLSISSGTVTVSGASDIDGTLHITAAGSYDANGNFDAANGAITFDGAGNLYLGGTVADLGTLSTDHGTVTYNGITDQSILAPAYNNLTISGSGTKTLQGDLVLANRINTLTVDASSATVVFDTDGYDVYATILSVTSDGSITDSGGDGRTTALNISTTSSIGSNITTKGAQTYTGAVTLTGNVTLDADNNNILFSNTVDADAAANNRTLTLDSGTAATTITGAAGSSQALDTLTVTNAGTVSLAAVDTRNGGLIFTNSATGTITLNGNISTDDEATAGVVTIKGAVVLGASVQIDTDSDTDAAISFSSTIDGADDNTQSLTLNAGSAGTISVTGAIGGTAGKQLATLTITNSNGTTFSNAVTTDTSVVLTDTAVNANITFNGALVTPALTVTGNDYDVDILGNGTEISNAVTFWNQGTLQLGDSPLDILTFNSGLTANTPDAITINGAIVTSNNYVSMGTNGAVTLAGGASSINTGSGAGNITISNAVNGTTVNSQSLTLNAGQGNILLQNAVIGATTALATLDFDGYTVQLNNIGAATAGVVGTTDIDAAYVIEFYGTTYNANEQNYTLDESTDEFRMYNTNTTTFTSSNDSISFNTGTIKLKDDDGHTKNTNLVINSEGGAVITAAIKGDYAGLTTGDVTITSTGGTANTVSVGIIGSDNCINTVSLEAEISVTLNGNITTNNSTGNTVTVTGPAILAANVSIDTNAAVSDGAINFTNTVNADANTNNRTLTLDSGTAGITITSDAGTTQALDTLTITNAETVSLAAVDTRDGGLIFTNAATGTITLNGNISTDDETTAGAVNIKGAVTLGDNVVIDTDALTTDGAIIFSSTIDASAAGTQTLGLTAGTGDITLSGIIGTTKLGAITISSAGTVNADAAVTASSFTVTTCTVFDSTGYSINTTGADETDGGAISITSTGQLTVGVLTSSGGSDTGSDGGHNAGAITLSGGDVTTTGIITAEGSAAEGGGEAGGAGGAVSITATDETPLITLGGSINSAGGAGNGAGSQGAGGSISFNNDVTLSTSVSLSTGSTTGNITFSGTINGSSDNTQSLTLNSGTGSISVTGAIGGTAGKQLATLTVTNSGGASFAAVTTDTGVVLSDTTGTVQFTGVLVTPALSTANKAYNISITGGCTITDNTDFINTGTLTIGNETANISTFTGGLVTTGSSSNPSSVTIAGTVQTENQQIDMGAVTVTASQTATVISGTAALNIGAVTLQDGATLQLQNGGESGGAVSVASVTGTTDGTKSDLTVNTTGTAEIGAIGTDIGTITNSGSGTLTFTGTVSAVNLDINAGSVSASGSSGWTFSGNVSVAGGSTLTAASGGNFYVGGNWRNEGTFTHNNSTVIFNGNAVQSITSGGSSFYNVIVNNTITSGTSIELSDNLAVVNNLIITDGIIDINNYTLAVTGSVMGATGETTVNDFSSDNMIVVNGTGYLQKSVTALSSYLFPVGTVSGGDTSVYEYSPITVQLISGGIGQDAYIRTTAVPEKYSENPSGTCYLNRYWNTTSGGISNINASVTCYYDQNDVVGIEEYIAGSEYISGGWITQSLVDSGTHSFTLTGLTGLAVFSGISSITIDRVDITPSSAQTVTAGNTLQFSAAAYDQYGNLITDTVTDFTWTGTNASGLFTSTTADSYTVTAAYGGISSDNVTVTVTPGNVSDVTISPSESQTIISGDTVQFSAAAYDAYSNLITSTATAFSWTNATAEGLFNTATVGSYSVKAAYSSVSSTSVVVTVNAKPSPNPRPDPPPINDGTDTQTHTSWRTSIDSVDDDNYYFETENDDLLNDTFTRTTAAISSLSNGEYGLTNTGASSGSSGISIGGGLDDMYNGEYAANNGSGNISSRTLNGAGSITEGEYGVTTGTGSSTNGEYGIGNFDFERYYAMEDLDGLIDFERIADYNDRHPLFKTELDLLLEKI